jgi:hypothetical protein
MHYAMTGGTETDCSCFIVVNVSTAFRQLSLFERNDLFSLHVKLGEKHTLPESHLLVNDNQQYTFYRHQVKVCPTVSTPKVQHTRQSK